MRARTTVTVLAILAAIGLGAGLGAPGSGAQEETRSSADEAPVVQALPPDRDRDLGAAGDGVQPAEVPVPDQYLVSLDEDIPPADVPEAAAALAEQVGGEVLRVLPLTLNGFAIEVDEAGAAELAASGEVAVMAQNGLNSGDAATVEELFPAGSRPEEFYNLDRISQRPLPRDQLYSHLADGTGVDVYVIDSGIRDTQVGFGGRAERGHDVFPLPVVAPPPNGEEPDPDCASSDPQVQEDCVRVNTDGLDCSGHGTHVAGTVGADLYGVARGAHLIGVRVLGCDNQGTDQDVVAGIEWMIDDADGEDPGTQADGPTVANMSLSGFLDLEDQFEPFDGPETVATEPIALAAQAAVDANITLVASAGNNSSSTACSFTPAAVPAAITVAASTRFDVRASFSNVGPCVDIVAPGDDIWSLSNVDELGDQTDDFFIERFDGTSMAAPAVSAAAAMVLEQNPTFTPAQVRSVLVNQATTGALSNLAGTPNRLLWVDGNTFADVESTNPFFVDIEWMASEGISTGTAGVPKPTYNPIGAVSRSAMSAFMYRLAGEPPFTPPVEPTFGDVAPSATFYAEIEWMAFEGISTGTAASPKPLYKPSDPVSRQAMSAFMYRLAGEPPFAPPAATTFLDVSAMHPFFAEIEWMASEGITTGTPGSPKPSYLPANAVSRQAMGAFMHRLADGPGVGV